MKTLIAYATETGVTKRCAEELAALIPGSVAANIAVEEGISMRDFDTVILGSYIRMGMIDPGMQFICDMGAELLAEKKLGLFVCAVETENADRYLKNGYGETLYNHASCRMCFGGEIPEEMRMNSRDRMILKYVTEYGGGAVDHNAITRFASEMNS